MEGIDVHKKRRRKRRAEDSSLSPSMSEEEVECSGRFDKGRRSRSRECPVPKPGGLIGQLMGFEKRDRERIKGTGIG